MKSGDIIIRGGSEGKRKEVVEVIRIKCVDFMNKSTMSSHS